MVKALTGPNFSGKSFYLQSYSGFQPARGNHAIRFDSQLFRDSRIDLYLGAVPDNFLSGFFSTVRAEIFRYKQSATFNEQELSEHFIDINWESFYSRNPFTLSGGEKAIISTLSFAISNPRALCIDSTLEQLSEDWKVSLLNFLYKLSIPEIILSDNRIAELPAGFFTVMDYKAIEEPHSAEMKLSGLNSDLMIIPGSYDNHELQINNLSFSYGKNEIFSDLNLHLKTGKIYHLKGKNGSGKSTLSKILSGLLKPGKGTAILLDKTKLNLYDHPGKYVGYTFQQPDDQLFGKSVKEELGMSEKNLSPTTKFVQSLIETFGLKGVLNFHPFELPVSIKKRLSIVAALSVNRPFYILDEPTLYLDDVNVKQLKLVLDKLALSGKGIVLISHSKTFIDSFNGIEILDIKQN